MDKNKVFESESEVKEYKPLMAYDPGQADRIIMMTPRQVTQYQDNSRRRWAQTHK